METMKASKVIFMTDVPETLLDKRVMRRHFTQFGTVRLVSLDKESACCSVCFTTTEAAHKAFLEGAEIENYRLKIMLGTSGSGPGLIDKTETLRDTHAYDDLDMNYLDDNNDVFVSEPSISEESQSETDLFKMKKKIIRKLHEDRKENPEKSVRKKKTSPDGSSKVTRKVVAKGPKLFKKASTATMTSEDLSVVKRLKQKFEILERRDKLYRKKLKASKLNVKSGTCPDMCPEKERIMRALRKLYMNYELRSGTNKFAPELAVKEYSRSSADQEEPLPHELRPEPVLQMTINYLVLNIMPLIETATDVNVSEWYDFLWNRLRALRKDIVQQQLCTENTANILEKCARFHILCFDRLCGKDHFTFDEKINTENLNNFLQSLIQMYDDLNMQGVHCSNEPEFRAYEILLKLTHGDINWEFQQLSLHLQKAPEILFALRVFSAFNNNLYASFFDLVKQTTYLNACLLQRYFSIVRSKALEAIVTGFCRSQGQAFKIPLNYLKSTLKFDDDNDVLNFCTAHNMIIMDDGDFYIGKYDFIIPKNKSSYLATTSLDTIKAKRVPLPITIAGSGEVPQEIHHKVHSSFDSAGNLKKDAINASDQIKKLRLDFGFIVENVPNIEIDEHMLLEEELEEKISSSMSDDKPPPVDNEKDTNIFSKSTSTSSESKASPQNIFQKATIKIFDEKHNSNEIFKSNPFQTGKTSLFSNSPATLFPTISSSSESDQSKPDSKPSLFQVKPLETNVFKIAIQPSTSTEMNIFSKSSESSSSTPPNPFLKSPTESNIFSKSSNEANAQKSITSSSLFSKASSDNIPSTSLSNIFMKPLNETNVFKKPIAESNINVFQKTQQIKSDNTAGSNLLGKSLADQPSDRKSDSKGSVFTRLGGLDNSVLFKRPGTFGEFMKPKNTHEIEKSSVGVRETSNVANSGQSPSPAISSLSSGFEKSYELFLQESEQQSRKRAADEQLEEQRQKEMEAIRREKEKQHQIEMERQRQKEIELQKQKEKELEMQRKRQLELERQREIEIQKEKELEEERQKKLEEQRQRELEKERLKQIELEKQRLWRVKLEEDAISIKVNYDLQVAMNALEKETKSKMKEHEKLMMRLKKEKELKMLRKIVKKKIKYMHARRCVKKWKERVEKLKINKLDFPQVVLTSIENHTAVWGSVRLVKNFQPFNMRERLDNITRLTETPLSTSNSYLGIGIMQLLKENKVHPRFINPKCPNTTPLVWKVSFHLPDLSEDFKMWEAQFAQFLRKFCYDDNHSLGQSECLKANGNTLLSNYNLLKGQSFDLRSVQGTNLYLFITSELWESLDQSSARFKFVTDCMSSDVHIVIVTYRSNYTLDQILAQFPSRGHNLSTLNWVTAADLSKLVQSSFHRHFDPERHPVLCFEEMSELLYNQVEVLFMQLQLDSELVVCRDDLVDKFKNPNYFINVYNTLLHKLLDICDATYDINLGAPYVRVLLNHEGSIIVNNHIEIFDDLVDKLVLPRFKTWPVVSVSKLLKSIKQFCAVIDLDGELYPSVVRRLNPPQENIEEFLRGFDWSSVLNDCILCHIRANMGLLRNKFLFYNRDMLSKQLGSHWWMNVPQ